MTKLKVSTRDIGSVRVFDLLGSPTQEGLQEVAWKIQRNIRRYRIQRIILNLQKVPTLEPLGLRKLIAACIRPQRSLIFGASGEVTHFLKETYLPRNMKICTSEKEIAEDLGPFLMEREKQKSVEVHKENPDQEGAGKELERRRSKRMKVALPIELRIHPNGEESILTQAIATNISEGGLFAEYLDLESTQRIDKMDPIKNLLVDIHVFSSANFPEEYRLRGKINRKELRKKQLGVAVEFVTD